MDTKDSNSYQNYKFYIFHFSFHALASIVSISIIFP